MNVKSENSWYLAARVTEYYLVHYPQHQHGEIPNLGPEPLHYKFSAHHTDT